LFAEWKAASFEEKEEIFPRLRAVLKRYAERMVWMVLRQTNTQLVTEMVDDLMMSLEVFEGRNGSKFSSWMHSVFRFRCLNELRYRRKYLGEALGTLDAETLEQVLDTSNVDPLEALIQRERMAKLPLVVQQRLAGLSAEEVALANGISSRRVRAIVAETIREQDEGNYA